VSFAIVAQLPEWPTGFSANLTAQVLNGLARGYAPWYTLHPLPPLYASGVQYRLEPNHGDGWEDFANPWTTYARGWGDCDDLVLWRLVELLVAGERVSATRAEWVHPTVHVLVRRQDRSLEDPSVILMRQQQ
jgi:hypothetical protein